jgi:hypothetical protein
MSESDFHRARDHVLWRIMALQSGGGWMEVIDVLRPIVNCSSAEDERMDDRRNFKVIDQDTNDEMQMGTSLIMSRSEGQHVL